MHSGLTILPFSSIPFPTKFKFPGIVFLCTEIMSEVEMNFIFTYTLVNHWIPLIFFFSGKILEFLVFFYLPNSVNFKTKHFMKNSSSRQIYYNNYSM